MVKIYAVTLPGGELSVECDDINVQGDTRLVVLSKDGKVAATFRLDCIIGWVIAQPAEALASA